MEKAKAIENLMRIRNMHNQRVFGAINDEEDEALAMAIEALEKGPTALDHIHNVVAENERKRGYEKAKAEYDHKLTEIKSRIKDHYYNKGYEQGKKDAAQQWIPFKTRPLKEEEKEEYQEWDCMLDCELPDDGQEILVSIKCKGHEAVQMDEFCTDDGCYLDSGYEIGTEATAWMPKPTPYEGEQK